MKHTEWLQYIIPPEEFAELYGYYQKGIINKNGFRKVLDYYFDIFDKKVKMVTKILNDTKFKR